MKSDKSVKNEIKASTAILLLVIFGGLLSAKFWALSASKSVNVLSYLHHHPDGSSFIMLDNQLFGFDNNGKHQRTIDLAKLGVQQSSATDFAFFSNGDLLVRQQTKEKNFIENLQRYFRYKNPTDKISTDDQHGLFRCNPATFKCKAFTNPALNLNDAFAITIDWATDRVFIADSNRHQIYLYSSEGEELDTADSFLFPNQIEFFDNKLYVADTNHHRLIAFAISDNQIGDVKETFDTRTTESRHLGEVWPSSFLLRSDERWVLNNKNGMNDGGIYIFDDNGEFKHKLQLPNRADPFSLLQMGEHVLISDYSLDRIYRYDKAGNRLGDFNPPVIQSTLAELTERRKFYQQLNHLFTILFTVTLIGGFVFALYQQYRIKTEEPEVFDTTPSKHSLANERVMHWIKTSTKFKLILGALTVLIACLVMALAGVHYFTVGTIDGFFNQYWRILIVALMTIIMSLLQLRRNVGITENTLIIRRPIGKPIVCAKRDIVSSDTFIVTGKSLFQINQLYRMFTDSDLENYLYPAIKQGRQVDRAELQAILGKNTWVRLIQLLIISALVGMFIYYGFTG